MISLQNLRQYTLILLFSFYNDILKPGKVLKETQVELKRLLSGQKHLLLLQLTWVWFPELTTEGLQPLITSSKLSDVIFWPSGAAGLHMMYTYKFLYTYKKIT